MTTNSERERDERPEERPRTRNTAGKAAGTAVSTAAVFKIVEQLGLLDLIVSKLRTRLESADIDELLDDAVAYLRRNPEAIVIGLGAITVASGILVFLERRDWPENETNRGRERGTTKPFNADRPRAATARPAAPRRRAS